MVQSDVTSWLSVLFDKPLASAKCGILINIASEDQGHLKRIEAEALWGGKVTEVVLSADVALGADDTFPAWHQIFESRSSWC